MLKRCIIRKSKRDKWLIHLFSNVRLMKLWKILKRHQCLWEAQKQANISTINPSNRSRLKETGSLRTELPWKSTNRLLSMSWQATWKRSSIACTWAKIGQRTRSWTPLTTLICKKRSSESSRSMLVQKTSSVNASLITRQEGEAAGIETSVTKSRQE